MTPDDETRAGQEQAGQQSSQEQAGQTTELPGAPGAGGDPGTAPPVAPQGSGEAAANPQQSEATKDLQTPGEPSTGAADPDTLTLDDQAGRRYEGAVDILDPAVQHDSGRPHLAMDEENAQRFLREQEEDRQARQDAAERANDEQAGGESYGGEA